MTLERARVIADSALGVVDGTNTSLDYSARIVTAIEAVLMVQRKTVSNAEKLKAIQIIIDAWKETL